MSSSFRLRGRLAVVALLSGDIDYITHNSRIVASAVRSGGVKSVFNYVARPIYYLVTLPEIKQPRELQGHTVGVSSFGGAAYYITRQVLEYYGLNVSKDVAIRALGQDSIRFSAHGWKGYPGHTAAAGFRCALQRIALQRVALRRRYRRYAYGRVGDHRQKTKGKAR